MKLNLTWKEDTRQYSNGENLFLNRLHIGHAGRNSSLSRSMPEEERLKVKYFGHTYLPALIDKRYYGSEIEEVKQKIEKVVYGWFNEAMKESK